MTDKHLEHSRAAVARRDILDALALLQRARREIGVLAGDHRRTLEALDAARLEGQRALDGVDRALKAMGRWFLSPG